MAQPPTATTKDAAHLRASEARAHYAPAEPRALGLMAGLAALVLMWLVLPVGMGVLFGALLALTLYHPYHMLARRTRKPALVALGITFLATTVVGGTLGVLLYALVLQGITVVGELPAMFAPGGAAAGALRPLEVFHLDPATIEARLRGAAVNIATSLAGWAAQAVGIVTDGLLALLFTAITMYFVLRHWRQLIRHAERLIPLNPHHTRRLMRELQRLGRAVVVGNFGTAVVQGAVAGIGYAIARMPEPGFFAAITAVASLVPVFGTLLVWLPAGVILLLSGHAIAGIFVLAWGAVAVVSLCDYFVRPKLVGVSDRAPMWLTLVALFGGIKLFGVAGLLLGPLLSGVAVSVLYLYERERRFRLGLD